jgi:hypothetical protein
MFSRAPSEVRSPPVVFAPNAIPTSELASTRLYAIFYLFGNAEVSLVWPEIPATSRMA